MSVYIFYSLIPIFYLEFKYGFQQAENYGDSECDAGFVF